MSRNAIIHSCSACTHFWPSNGHVAEATCPSCDAPAEQDLGIVTMRNEDGTQYFSGHFDTVQWSHDRRDAILVGQRIFADLKSMETASRHNDSPDTGFFGVYQLAHHAVSVRKWLVTGRDWRKFRRMLVKTIGTETADPVRSLQIKHLDRAGRLRRESVGGDSFPQSLQRVFARDDIAHARILRLSDTALAA